MSEARIVIDYIQEQIGINLDTLIDKDFSQFSWLTEREPIVDMKGQKVSKSYYVNFRGKEIEAVRIEYKKLIGDYVYEGVLYSNTFIGVSKDKLWLRWDGTTAKSKADQNYIFTLQPIFDTTDTALVVGFSSRAQRKILKEERYNADDWLQSQNPTLYLLLYNAYTSLYDSYLRSGNKTALVDAINSETDVNLNEIFERNVYGLNITIKELILMNLQ